MPLWVTNSVSWQEVHYYMVYIEYYTELNLQVWNYAQKRRICGKNSDYAPDKKLYGYFCYRRKVANFCHPKWAKKRHIWVDNFSRVPLFLQEFEAIMSRNEDTVWEIKCLYSWN